MKRLINNEFLLNNLVLKFILAAIASLGFYKMVGFLTEEELDGEELEILEDEEYPLFV